MGARREIEPKEDRGGEAEGEKAITQEGFGVEATSASKMSEKSNSNWRRRKNVASAF